MMNDIEALKIAVEMEKESLSRYLQFARKTKDMSGKNMFIRLATDELTHMDMLNRALENLMEQKGWIMLDIDRSEVEKVVPQLRKQDVRIRTTEGLDELSALETALELEERGIKYYKEQGEKVESEEAKNLYKRLEEMEMSHYDLIMSELDYIKNTGFWFGVREFSLEVY
jgi:rubrerythrin